MKDNHEAVQKEIVAVSDMTCSFSHEGKSCPIPVSAQFESTWLCSRHFKHLRRGQGGDSITFLNEVISNPRKFLQKNDRQDFWFEEELRNYNHDANLWVSIMPKPNLQVGGNCAHDGNIKASDFIGKRIAELEVEKSINLDKKSLISNNQCESSPWNA